MFKFIVRFYYISFLMLIVVPVYAELEVGAGFSSFTSGQSVPSLMLELKMSNSCLDFTSTGYSSQYDYLSGYSSSYYWPSKMGSLLGGELEVGLGFGVYYTQRGFRDVKTASVNSTSDYGAGPAFFASWRLGKWFFVRMQSLLGLGNANNLALFFQDVSNFSIGISL